MGLFHFKPRRTALSQGGAARFFSRPVVAVSGAPLITD